MNSTIECGVFYLDIFKPWIDRFIDNTQKETQKIKLFPINIKLLASCEAFTIGNTSFPQPSILNNLLSLFERYDCLILPVMPNSLIWTRIMLSQLSHFPRCPIITLAYDLQPNALLDLTALGINDYIFESDNTTLLRVRINNQVAKNRRHNYPPIERNDISLPSSSIQKTIYKKTPKIIKQTPSQSVINTDNIIYHESFQEAKSKVVAEFERRYLYHVMTESQGNISVAATKASKNRRAFWELLRKHNIQAEDFRDSNTYLQTPPTPTPSSSLFPMIKQTSD